MKKIFFTALVAVVAVGAAYTQYYPIGSNVPTYNCPEGQLTCGIKYGVDPLVSPFPSPNQVIQIRLSTLGWGPE